MINCFKTQNGTLVGVDTIQEDCWISVINPTNQEIQQLSDRFAIEPAVFQAALDEEERSRVESEDNYVLIIVDTPVADTNEKSVAYYTDPIGVIITDKYIITVSLHENAIISEFEKGLVKNVSTNLKTRFLLQLLYRIATRYLLHLRQIEKIFYVVEKKLNRTMQNKELVQLLELEKSLIYFSTSLKSNEMTINKISRGKIVKLYEDDEDLFEDVLIEIKQAIETTNINSQVISGTMNAFSSVISNNLNMVMRTLTAITIIIAIPTMIVGFYGMNIPNLPFDSNWYVPTAITAVVTGAVGFILYRKKLF